MVHFATTTSATSTHLTFSLLRSEHTWKDVLYRHCESSISGSTAVCVYLQRQIDAVSQRPDGMVWRRLAGYPVLAAPTSLHLCHAFRRAATTSYKDARLDAASLQQSTAKAEVTAIMYATSIVKVELAIKQLLDCDDENIVPAFAPLVSSSRLRRASSYSSSCGKCECSGCDCNSG
jgi:hypothetical protein